MSAPPTRHDAAWNMRGALFMVLAMAGFAVEDAFLKLASRTLPIGQILLSFGLFGLLVFSALAIRAGETPLSRLARTRVVAVRSSFEVAGRLFFMLALALTPLSTASAILQSAPLVVIAGAALFFGERVGAKRWAAVLAGLSGVLLILRPGLDGFSLLSLLAVGATIGFAGRDLATRAAPAGLSHNQLGVLGFLSLALAGLVALPFGAAPATPDLGAALGLLAGSGAGVVGYAALTAAMRTGEIGAVTPFRYTRLVFAMLAGILVFGERPDGWTLIGSVIVVGAGIVALAAPSGGRARLAAASQPD